jgi:hypothetical protein
VSLVSTVPGVILSSPITIGAGAGAAKFCFTLDSNYDPHAGFGITATLDGHSETVYGASVFVPAFSESLSASQTQPMYLGESSPPITVSVTAQPGYSSTVQLDCERLLPGWSCQFTPSQLALTPGATATASLVVTSSNSPLSPNDSFYVTATDGTFAERQQLQVNTVQLRIRVAGSSTIWEQSPGKTPSTTFDYDALGSHSESCTGLPAGASCDLVDVSGTNQVNMTVTLPGGVAAGSIPIQVNIASKTYTANTTMMLDLFSDSLGAPASDTTQGIAGSTVNLVFPFQSTNLPSSTEVDLVCAMDGVACTRMSFASAGAQLPMWINLPSSLTTGAHTLAITTTILGYSQT